MTALLTACVLFATSSADKLLCCFFLRDSRPLAPEGEHFPRNLPEHVGRYESHCREFSLGRYRSVFGNHQPLTLQNDEPLEPRTGVVASSFWVSTIGRAIGSRTGLDIAMFSNAQGGCYTSSFLPCRVVAGRDLMC